jgi:hypothetical protein
MNNSTFTNLSPAVAHNFLEQSAYDALKYVLDELMPANQTIMRSLLGSTIYGSVADGIPAKPGERAFEKNPGVQQLRTLIAALGLRMSPKDTLETSIRFAVNQLCSPGHLDTNIDALAAVVGHARVSKARAMVGVDAAKAANWNVKHLADGVAAGAVYTVLHREAFGSSELSYPRESDAIERYSLSLLQKLFLKVDEACTRATKNVIGAPADSQWGRKQASTAIDLQATVHCLDQLLMSVRDNSQEWLENIDHATTTAPSFALASDTDDESVDETAQ